MITTCIYYLPPALPFKSYIQSRISISILVHRKRKSPFSSCQQVTRGGNTWKSSILRVVLKEEDEEWWGKKRKERWMVITLFEGMYTIPLIGYMMGLSLLVYVGIDQSATHLMAVTRLKRRRATNSEEE